VEQIKTNGAERPHLKNTDMKKQKFKKVRSAKNIENDPRVDQFYSDSDGWWILLYEPFQWFGGQIMHEYSIRQLCSALNYDVEEGKP